MSVHLPNAFQPERMTGTLCGLAFGVGGTPRGAPHQVITDAEEVGDVDCDTCLYLYAAYRAGPPPGMTTTMLTINHDEAQVSAAYLADILLEVEGVIEVTRDSEALANLAKAYEEQRRPGGAHLMTDDLARAIERVLR